MRLFDLKTIINGKWISDGVFETLEYCTAEVGMKVLSFIEKEKFVSKMTTNVSCVFCTMELVDLLPETVEGICVVEEPKKAFVVLHNELAKNAVYAGESKKTRIGENCKISEMAYIASENVVIGNNVEIEPFVVINSNVEIGNNCIIHSGTTIGGKGFNFVKTTDGEMLGMKDLGKVVLKDNVEVCSNCHVANGPLPTDVTLLDEYVKLDAFVHVGHGSRIGKRTLIPAGAQISGNVVVGEDCWIGVNATIANRINVGNHGRVSLGSVVTKHVPDNSTVTGNFAIEHQRFIENLRSIRG